MKLFADFNRMLAVGATHLDDRFCASRKGGTQETRAKALKFYVGLWLQPHLLISERSMVRALRPESAPPDYS